MVIELVFFSGEAKDNELVELDADDRMKEDWKQRQIDKQID